MGKWAQYRKRGTAPAMGTIGAPIAADWTVSAGAAGVINANRVAGFPPGMDGFQGRARLSVTPFTVTAGSVTSGTPSVISGLTTGQTYQVQVAWWKGAAQSSEWSDVKTQVAP